MAGKQKNEPSTIGILFGLVLFGFLYFQCQSCTARRSDSGGGSRPSSGSETTVTELGATGTIRETCYAAVSPGDLDECVTAMLARDSIGLAQGVLDGRWWRIDKGSRGKLIDSKFLGARRVRFDDGRAGWVPPELFTTRH